MPDKQGARPLRMKELAAKIDAYLKRFEAEKKMKLYMAGAVQSGRFVYVRYVSYQGVGHLSREQAEKYLAFLEQGGIGQHYRIMEKGR
jgi:hypothetical protein